MAKRKATGGRPKSNPAKGEPLTWRDWLRRIVKGGLALALIGTVALATWVAIAANQLPDYQALKQSKNEQTIRIRANDGTVIVSMGPNYGQWMSLDELPPVMTDAMVAVEDRRFYSHFGIDPVGMARAVYTAWERRGSGRRWQGASTITQQVARNLFLTNSYSLGRKVNEAVLSFALEWKFSKSQIVELYLNKVYFGGGSYGVDAASRRFFGHSAHELSLEEAAIIAGLVKAPSRYSPTADAQAAIDRASVVLQVMQDAGAITPAQAAAAQPTKVKLARQSNQNSARYFTDWALPQLDMLIDETNDPIDVWTTLDLPMQQAATNAISKDTPGGLQGALVSLDRDGAVRAMVGGRDYVTSNYNRATQAVRQPGSAWKIFVYMAALESGYRPEDTVVDEPVSINGWTPKNSSGRFSGKVSVRTAFAYSINTVAAQIGNEVGYSSIANMARRFGISTPINTHPSMVLGSSEVRVIDMARAVAAIQRKGVSVTPYAITKVTTADGDVLYQHREAAATQLVDDWVAAGITDLMQTAVNTGTGRAAQIGRPVAGKTGTTNSNKDGWFVGFSSGLATAVWMGRDDAKAVGGLQGGRAPTSAWADYMRIAVAKRPVENFDTQVTLPDWVLSNEQDQYLDAPDDGMLVDENGMPIEIPIGPAQPGEQPPAIDRPIDQQWIDEMTGRKRPSAPTPQPARPDAPREQPGRTPQPNQPPPPSNQEPVNQRGIY